MNKKLNINERILYLIENQYNGNQKKFAESIGYSAQVVFNIVSGRKTKPSYEVLNAIASTNVYVSSEWLLTGNGNMLKSEVPIQEDLSKITSLERENTMLKETNDLLRFKVSTLESIISQEKGKRQTG